MKNKALVAVTAGLCLSMVSLPGIAHHSFAAQFDAEKPMELTGTVNTTGKTLSIGSGYARSTE